MKVKEKIFVIFIKDSGDSSYESDDLFDDTIIINMKREDLKKFTAEKLSDFLSKNCLPYSGNKDKLCDRICKYVETIQEENKKVKRMIETDSLGSLTNEELYNILYKKNLKTSGNKDEKIKTLKEYFKNL